MQRNRPLQLKKPDPELLAKFRPPALETFFVGALRGLQIVCLVGSAAAFVKYFLYNAWTDTDWLPFAIFVAFLLSFYRGLWLEEAGRPNHFLVTLSELLAIFLAMAGLWFVFSTLDLAFLLDFVGIGLGWYWGRGWLGLFYYLFVQPYEFTKAEGGTGGADGHRQLYDHREPYRELKSVWYWMGGWQIALVLGGISLANYDKERAGKADFIQILLIAGAVHLLLGLPLLAWARLRYLRTGWRLNRLTEPVRLATRWGFYLMALLLIALPPALALTTLNLGDQVKLPSFEAGPTRTPQPLVLPSLGPLLYGTPRARTEPPPPQSELFHLPDELTIILISLIVSTILYLALQLLIKAGWVGPRWQKFRFSLMWQGFWNWLRSLFGPRRQREGFEKGGRLGNGFDPLRRFRRDRLPDDPRGRVRFHYRQMEQRASRAGLPRHASQTPDEYANYLGPKLDDPELTPDLGGLTNLYEEARFSPHPIDENQASEARQHTERLTTHFRQQSRRARAANRPKPPTQPKP